MKNKLPYFKYHPDPISTGVFEPLNEKCDCCGQRTKYTYTPSVYSRHDINYLCPWCIANGTVKEKFNAQFTPNVASADNEEVLPWSKISKNVEDEIVYKTPGFVGSQEEHWWSHCNDGAAFLGYLGDIDKKIFAEPQAQEFIKEMKKVHEIDDDEWEWLINTPDEEHSTRFYIFRCLHCKRIGGYGDFS